MSAQDDDAIKFLQQMEDRARQMAAETDDPDLKAERTERAAIWRALWVLDYERPEEES